MTVKHLTGSYPDGYDLSSRYSGLVIAHGARVGGEGVSVRFSAFVRNFGVIDAPSGDAGIDLFGGGTLVNGSVRRGESGASAQAGAIIKGPTGVYVRGGAGVVTNFTTISGKARAGVILGAGGAVTNGSNGDTAALIEGASGVQVRRGAGEVGNFGRISATYGYGVQLVSGTVTNGSASDREASIAGRQGGVSNGTDVGLATVINFGQIDGGQGFGVKLAGGTVTNGSAADTGALIDGGAGGVSARTVANYGTIRGAASRQSGAVGVISTGGSVVNGAAGDSAALIEGYIGVEAHGARLSLTDWGVIKGDGGVAVTFDSASDRLNVETGAVFDGAVLGHGATLDLAADQGTITRLGGDQLVVSGQGPAATFSAFGEIQIGRAAHFTLEGNGEIGAGRAHRLTVNGMLVVADTLTVSGTLGGAGILALGQGARVEIDGAAPRALRLEFSGAGASLVLKDPSAVAATIAGFAPGQTLDLLGVKATAAVRGPGDTLLVKDGAATVATLRLAGHYRGVTFTASPDGAGGTDITVNAEKRALSGARLHRFVATAAAIAPTGAGHAPTGVSADPRTLLLGAPRIRTA